MSNVKLLSHKKIDFNGNDSYVSSKANVASIWVHTRESLSLTIFRCQTSNTWVTQTLPPSQIVMTSWVFYDIYSQFHAYEGFEQKLITSLYLWRWTGSVPLFETCSPPQTMTLILLGSRVFLMDLSDIASGYGRSYLAILFMSTVW